MHIGLMQFHECSIYNTITMDIIRIRAIIKLYSDVRRIPFSSGYRPLFDFIKETKTSG